MKCYRVTFQASPRYEGEHKERLLRMGYVPEDVGFFDASNPDPSMKVLMRDEKSSVWPDTTMNLGECCCCLGHLDAYNKLLESEDDFCLIVEDDAIPLVKSEQLAEKLKGLPQGFDGCLLYKQNAHQEEIDNPDFLRSRNCGWGTVAYIISRDGAKKVINQKTFDKSDVKLTALSFKSNFYIERCDSFTHDAAVKSTIR